MTLEELINTFGNRNIYHYHGKRKNLEEILFTQSLSYNYVICGKDIYFVCENQVDHPEINLFHNHSDNIGE